MAATMAYALVALLAYAQAPQVLVVGGPGASREAHARASSTRMLSSAQLGQMLRQDVVPKLPVGARLVRIEPFGDLRIPRGKTSVDVALPQELVSGAQEALATVRSGSWEQQIPVRLSLALFTAQGRAAPVIKRGAEVLVIVRSGNVLVQSMGTAQENGGAEEPISVIPNASGRVIRGRVKDARTVEVVL